MIDYLKMIDDAYDVLSSSKEEIEVSDFIGALNKVELVFFHISPDFPFIRDVQSIKKQARAIDEQWEQAYRYLDELCSMIVLARDFLQAE